MKNDACLVHSTSASVALPRVPKSSNAFLSNIFFFISSVLPHTFKQLFEQILEWEVIVILMGYSSVCVAFVCQKCHCCQETLREDVKRQQTERTDYLDYPETCPLHANKFRQCSFPH